MFTITDTYKQNKTKKQKLVLYVTFPPTLVNDFYQKTDRHTGPYIFLAFGKIGIYPPALQVVIFTEVFHMETHAHVLTAEAQTCEAK